jgi:hypothetical protein
MKLTLDEITANAQDFIGMSENLKPGEKIDRTQLAEQMQYTIADSDDIAAIAEMIESING